MFKMLSIATNGLSGFAEIQAALTRLKNGFCRKKIGDLGWPYFGRN